MTSGELHLLVHVEASILLGFKVMHPTMALYEFRVSTTLEVMLVLSVFQPLSKTIGGVLLPGEGGPSCKPNQGKVHLLKLIPGFPHNQQGVEEEYIRRTSEINYNSFHIKVVYLGSDNQFIIVMTGGVLHVLI